MSVGAREEDVTILLWPNNLGNLMGGKLESLKIALLLIKQSDHNGHSIPFFVRNYVFFSMSTL